jgi:hypothetical protein
LAGKEWSVRYAVADFGCPFVVGFRFFFNAATTLSGFMFLGLAGRQRSQYRGKQG